MKYPFFWNLWSQRQVIPAFNPVLKAWLLLGIGLLVYCFAKMAVVRASVKPDLVIGSKNFTESLIVSELYALALEKAGYHIERKFNLGGTWLAHEALVKGEIDLYPEYTGTGLIDILHEKTGLDETGRNALLFNTYRKRWDLLWLTPSQANDSQAIAVMRPIAKKYHLYTLSRLPQVAPALRFASIPEFEDREDGLKGLQQKYGSIHFKWLQLFDNSLKYRVLSNGQADATVAFTTDGALINPDFIVLRDDRQFWPVYRVAPVIRAAAAHRHPPVIGILNHTSRLLDTLTLRQLNAAVDQKKQDYQTAAKSFLKAKGIL